MLSRTSPWLLAALLVGGCSADRDEQILRERRRAEMLAKQAEREAVKAKDAGKEAERNRRLDVRRLQQENARLKRRIAELERNRPKENPNVNENGNDIRTKVKGRAESVTSIDVSSDGGFAATADIFGKVQLWRLPNLTRLQKFTANTGPGVKNRAYSVRISRDGKTVACGSGDRTVWVWDRGTGNLRYRVRGFEASVRNVILPAKRDRGVAIDELGNGRVWQLSTGKILQQFKIDGGLQTSFSPDGDRVLYYGNKLFNITTHSTTKNFLSKNRKSGLSEHPTSTAFSHDGKLIAFASSLFRGSLEVWDSATRTRKWSSPGGGSTVRIVAFSQNGRWLASTGAATVRFWDVGTGDEVGRQKIREFGRISAMRWLPDNTGVLVAISKWLVLVKSP